MAFSSKVISDPTLLAVALTGIIASISPIAVRAAEQTERRMSIDSRLPTKWRVTDIASWQAETLSVSSRDCGIDALYLLLTLLKQECSYRTINEKILLGPDGASFQQLQETAADMGVALDSILCPPSILPKLSMPAIAQIEPTSGDEIEGLKHFVVVVSVDNETVTIADPFSSRVYQFTHAEFCRIATGYYLVPHFVPIMKYVGIFWVGMGAISLVMWMRRRRLRCGNPQQSSEMSSLGWSGKMTMMLVLSSLGVLLEGGCSKNTEFPTKTSPESPPEQTSATDSKLEVKVTEIKLGYIDREKPFKGTFKFRNKTDLPIVLSPGEPNCTCLNAMLRPGATLPAKAEGELILTLDADSVRTGPISGRMFLGVKGTNETYDFSVSGMLEGPTTWEPYVLRARDVKAGKAAPLVFKMYLADQDAPFEVVSITCHRKDIDPSGKPITVKPGDIFPVGAGQSVGSIRPRLDAIVIRPAIENDNGIGFVRTVVVPIEASAPSSGVMGEFAVRYRLRGEERVAPLDLLVIDPSFALP